MRILRPSRQRFSAALPTLLTGSVFSLFLLTSGCHKQQDTLTGPQAKPRSERGTSLEGKSIAAEAQPANSASGGEPRSPSGDTAQPDAEAQERWEVYFMEGTQVGYGRTRWRVREGSNGTVLEMGSSSKLTIQRFDQTVTQMVSLVSVETPDGAPQQFQCELSQGQVKSVTRGAVGQGVIRLATTTLGRTEESQLSWKEGAGGFFADQQSLRKQPMKPGETRTLQALIPVLNQLGSIELRAVDWELTPLLAGERKLLRIEHSVIVGETQLDSQYWVDKAGEIHKSTTEFSGLEQVTYRTDRQTALRQPARGSFDLGTQTVVRVDKRLTEPHRTRKVVYRLKHRDGAAASHFTSGTTQWVEADGDQTAVITVWARRPGDGVETGMAPEKPPTSADRNPNSLIQSDDPQVQALAARVPEDLRGWELACALEKLVHQSMRNTRFSQALASAADVARTLEGDCTEHAVLLAALCRARELPARVAIGLVYYGQASGFAYHMWTEVWVDGAWLPIDGTLGRGGIGAAHLRVTSSNLEGATPYSALLPVMNVIGEIELQILRSE